jgi:hypothetical protein
LGPQRRITRWEHKHLLEAVQQRLDENPQAIRQRSEKKIGKLGGSRIAAFGANRG